MTNQNPLPIGPIRVLIVDDHMPFRHAVLGLLSRSADVEIVGEAANGLEAVEKATMLKPDVVFMDINMPKMGGIEAACAIKLRFPEMIIIGLTADGSESRTAMYAAGASMVLTKENMGEELHPALQKAMGNSITEGMKGTLSSARLTNMLNDTVDPSDGPLRDTPRDDQEGINDEERGSGASTKVEATDRSSVRAQESGTGN